MCRLLCLLSAEGPTYQPPPSHGPGLPTNPRIGVCVCSCSGCRRHRSQSYCGLEPATTRPSQSTGRSERLLPVQPPQDPRHVIGMATTVDVRTTIRRPASDNRERSKMVGCSPPKRSASGSPRHTSSLGRKPSCSYASVAVAVTLAVAVAVAVCVHKEIYK